MPYRQTVFAFDRDATVSSGGGPVPLAVVQRLARDHPVYAIGNQDLVAEAAIPGLSVVGLRHGLLSVVFPWVRRRRKERALTRLRERHPEAAAYIVVDDTLLSSPGWTYYAPDVFAEIAADISLTSDTYLGP